MKNIKNRMWELLSLISLKPYSKIELTNELKIDLKSLFNLILFVNNYCNKKVINIINDNIYLDKDFIFFIDKDFKKYDKNLNFEIINSIDSTNDLLIKYLKNNININNKIIIANEQTNGRGRLDRKWFSSLGNSIIFSIGINCLNKIKELSAITLVVSYSCVCILRKYNIPVTIKWPNDIVVDNLKLGGILVNNINNTLIIGVGLNYNNISNIDNDITFIKKYNNYSIKQIFQEIITKIFSNVNQFQKNGFNDFKDNYLSYLRDINCYVNILQNNIIKYQGKVLGISDKGELILQYNKNLYYVVSGDLSLRTI